MHRAKYSAMLALALTVVAPVQLYSQPSGEAPATVRFNNETNATIEIQCDYRYDGQSLTSALAKAYFKIPPRSFHRNANVRAGVAECSIAAPFVNGSPAYNYAFHWNTGRFHEWTINPRQFNKWSMFDAPGYGLPHPDMQKPSPPKPSRQTSKERCAPVERDFAIYWRMIAGCKCHIMASGKKCFSGYNYLDYFDSKDRALQAMKRLNDRFGGCDCK